MTTLLAGLVLGLAGGAHCVGMCGPLLAAFSPRGAAAVIHHASRSATYLLLGLMAGSAGAGMSATGLGRWVAWIGAASLLAFALLPHAVPMAPRAFVRQAIGLLARGRQWSRAHPRSGAAVVGALNGLLPCGLVYSAAIAAIGTGTVAAGVLFMAGFAAGTTVTLASAGAIWLRVRDHVRARASRLAPIAYVAVAVLLVWRSLIAATPHH